MREKFVKQGLDAFHDHEVLEMLLFQSIPYKDTNELAHRLLNQYGSLANILDAGYDSLITVKGISHVTAVNLLFCRQLLERYGRSVAKAVYIDKLSKVIGYAQMLFTESRYERLVAVFVDKTTKVVCTREYTSEHVDKIKVDMKQIITDGMNLHAHGLFLVHCHTSSDTTPSPADIRYTRHIKQLLNSMEMVLMEHLIVNNNGKVFSFLNNKEVRLNFGTNEWEEDKTAVHNEHSLEKFMHEKDIFDLEQAKYDQLLERPADKAQNAFTTQMSSKKQTILEQTEHKVAQTLHTASDKNVIDNSNITNSSSVAQSSTAVQLQPNKVTQLPPQSGKKIQYNNHSQQSTNATIQPNTELLF